MRNTSFYSRIVELKKIFFKTPWIPEKYGYRIDNFFNSLHNSIVINFDKTRDNFIHSRDVTRDSIVRSKDLTRDSIVRSKDLTRDSIIHSRDVTRDTLIRSRDVVGFAVKFFKTRFVRLIAWSTLRL